MVDKKRTSKKKVNAKTIVRRPAPQTRSKKVRSNPQLSASTGTTSPAIGPTVGPTTNAMVKANQQIYRPGGLVGANNMRSDGKDLVGINTQRYMPGLKANPQRHTPGLNANLTTPYQQGIPTEGIGQVNDLIESTLNAKPIQEMSAPNNAYTPDLGEFKVPMKDGKFTASGEAVARKIRKTKAKGKK